MEIVSSQTEDGDETAVPNPGRDRSAASSGGREGSTEPGPHRSSSNGTKPSANGDRASKDDVFKALSNRRRRHVLHFLEWRDGTVRLDETAERIAAWENGTSVDGVSSTERKRVYTALQQFHLPKLEDAGLVRYDDRAGTIERAEPRADVDVYLDLVPEDDIPWSHYYLGLSIIALSMTGLSAVGLPVLSLLSPAIWAAVFLVAALGSASVHAYRDRRQRLGGDEPPPETRLE